MRDWNRDERIDHPVVKRLSLTISPEIHKKAIGAEADDVPVLELAGLHAFPVDVGTAGRAVVTQMKLALTRSEKVFRVEMPLRHFCRS